MALDPRFAAYAAEAGLPAGLPAGDNTLTLEVGDRGIQLLYNPDEDMVGYAAALSGVGTVPARRLSAFTADFLFRGGYGLFALPSGAGIVCQRRPRSIVPPDRLIAELGHFGGLADRVEAWCRSVSG